MVDIEECVGCRAIDPEHEEIVVCSILNKPISEIETCPIEIAKIVQGIQDPETKQGKIRPLAVIKCERFKIEGYLTQNVSVEKSTYEAWGCDGCINQDHNTHVCKKGHSVVTMTYRIS